MTVRKILTIDDDKNLKLLRTRSEPVKRIDKKIKDLVQDIFDTIEANPAVGLAAPQIGVLKRLFGLKLSEFSGEGEEVEEKSLPPMIMINPEILEKSEDTERGYDACLSIPGKMGYTDRYLRLKVRYQDETGQKITRDFDGWNARVIQHELDHLDGILFIDRLKSYEDLYVYVKDKEGKTQTVPYLQVIENATKSVDQIKPEIASRPSKENSLKPSQS